MSDIETKLENYLNDEESNDDNFHPNEDVVLMDRMMSFIIDLNTENLSEDQIDEVTDIIDSLADEDLDEAFSAKKVKIKPQEKRRRHREYRRNRAQTKLRAKKFRRTTKYKQWKRMKVRKARSGKTARGKRIRKFM
jgi:hypothetical protein